MRSIKNSTGTIDLTFRKEMNTGGVVTTILFIETEKKIVEDMVSSQKIDELKFKNKGRETFPKEGLVVGMECNVINIDDRSTSSEGLAMSSTEMISLQAVKDWKTT